MKAKSKAQYYLNTNESAAHGRYLVISNPIYPTQNNNNNVLTIDNIQTTDTSTNNTITEYSYLLDCKYKL